MKARTPLALAGMLALLLAGNGFGQINNYPDTRLTPPGPPQDDVMKTIDMVEPRIPISSDRTPGVQSATTYEIGRPGSYYLTENLMGTSPETGIVIYASNVTLDLSGYSLIGSTNSLSPNNAPGIVVDSNATSVVIENGSVTLWQNGIISRGINLTVRNLDCSNNSFDGLRAEDMTVVQDCTFRFNLGEGLELGRNSRVVGVTSKTNGYGIVVGKGSLVKNCVANGNLNHGIRLTGPGARVESCVASSNNKGIQVDANRCTVVNNTCSNNKSEGIACGELATTFYRYCYIDGNHVTGNAARGLIVTGTDNVIVRNVAADNGFAYAIGASNQVGTVVTSIDVTGFSGSSGGNLDATIGPWANFAR